jgi:hypothetical protein
MNKEERGVRKGGAGREREGKGRGGRRGQEGAGGVGGRTQGGGIPVAPLRYLTRSAPTKTVSPSAAHRSVMTPASGARISTVTLSVSTSHRISSISTWHQERVRKFSFRHRHLSTGVPTRAQGHHLIAGLFVPHRNRALRDRVTHCWHLHQHPGPPRQGVAGVFLLFAASRLDSRAMCVCRQIRPQRGRARAARTRRHTHGVPG